MLISTKTKLKKIISSYLTLLFVLFGIFSVGPNVNAEGGFNLYYTGNGTIGTLQTVGDPTAPSNLKTEAVQAQEAATTDDSSSTTAPLTWTPNITIGSFTQGQAETISGDRNILGEYISIWYKFLVGIAGLLATIMIIMGGVTWLTSGGSSAIIGDAKKTISSALIGLTLALLSYILLQVINPNLTTMKMPSLTNIEFSGDYKIPHTNRIGATEGLSQGANGMPAPYQSGTKIPCDDQLMDYNQAFTASYEGYNSTPYADQHGWTYGFGHNSDNNPGTVDYNTELRWFTDNYNNTYYPGARTAYSNAGGDWDSLSQQNQAVLTDIAYQFGTRSGFLTQTATLMAQGNNTGAANFMRNNYLNYFRNDPGSGVASRINSNASIIENKDPITGEQSDGQQQFTQRALSSCNK